MPVDEAAKSAFFWVTAGQAAALVGASFAATVVGALVLGSAADKIDPALLEDGAGGGAGGAGGAGAGPRRARVSLAAEREAEQRQQQQQQEGGGAAKQQQQKQDDGTT